MAHLGRADQARPCPLLRPKRTCSVRGGIAANDPIRTSTFGPTRECFLSFACEDVLRAQEIAEVAGERVKLEPHCVGGERPW
jgi:hypothetical protein